MGLRAAHIRSMSQRDRMLMLVALVHTLLMPAGSGKRTRWVGQVLEGQYERTQDAFAVSSGSVLVWMHRDDAESLMRPLMEEAYDSIAGEQALFSQIFGVK